MPIKNPSPKRHKSISEANPFVFVVGCPRSGTTLLQRMLDNHPRLAVANDTHFIPRAAAKDLKHYHDPPLTPELVAGTFKYHRFYRMGLSWEELQAAAALSNTYSHFVHRLYDRFGQNQGKPLAGEKTPDYGRCLPTLTDLFPGTPIVHIIRDGRDVALSTRQWAERRGKKGPSKWALWELDPIAACAYWWIWQVYPAVEFEEGKTGEKVLRLYYEDLVKNPEGELQQLSRFLGLDYSEAMLEFHLGKEKKWGQGSAKSLWKPAIQGLRDWRKEMAEDDKVVFDGIAGPLLKKLGYEIRTKEPNDSQTKRIVRARSWWRQSKFGQKLPIPWS